MAAPPPPGYEGGDDGTSLAELVDLALCAPEVGAVNFNILRILFHELLRKLNLDDVVADLDDLQAAQIEGFKNYIQGAGSMSPMPGVLKFSPSSKPMTMGATGPTYHAHKGGFNVQIPSGVVTPRSGAPPQGYNQQPQQQQGQQQRPGGPAQGGMPQQQQGYPQQPGAPQQQAYQQQVGAPQAQGYPQQQQQQQPGMRQGPPQAQGVQAGPPGGGSQQRPPSQGQGRPGVQQQGVQTVQAQGAQTQGPQGYPPQQGQMGPPQQYPQQGPPQQQQYAQAGPPMQQQQYPQQPGQQQYPQQPGQQYPQQPGQQQYPQQPGQQQYPQQPGQPQYPPQGPPGQQQRPPMAQQYQQTMPPQPGQPQQMAPGQSPRQMQQQGVQAGPPQGQQQGRPQQPGQQQRPGQYPQQQPGQQQYPQQVPGQPQQYPQQPGQQQYAPQQQQQYVQGPPGQQQQYAQTGQQYAPQQQYQQAPPGQYQQGPPQQYAPQGGQMPPPGQPGQWQAPPQQGYQQAPPGQYQGQPMTNEQMYQAVAGQLPPAEGGGLSPAGGYGGPPVRRKGQRPDGTPNSQASGGSDRRQSISPGGRSDGSTSTPRRDSSRLAKLEDKIRKLESHLESLYNLPDNPALIGMLNNEDTKGMSINDMWQVIQLNNRVAATEAAIQKMASLIEDLAKQLKKFKQECCDGEGKNILGAAQTQLDRLRKDLDRAKRQLRDDIDLLAKATGIDPSRLHYVPSFMRPSQQMAIIYDENGQPLLGPDGQPLSYGQVVLDEHGVPLLDANGHPIPKSSFTAAHPVLDANGNPIVGPDGQPIMTQNMVGLFDADGNELLGADGRKLSNKLGMLMRNKDGSLPIGPLGQPFVIAEGHLLLDESGAPISGPDGRLVYVETGRLSLDANNDIIKRPDGVPMYKLSGDPMMGSDGKQLVAADALPLFVIRPDKPPTILKGPQGQTVMLHGRPLVSDQVLLGPNGEPYIGPDGHPIAIYDPDLGQIQLDQEGKPLIGDDGFPMYSHKGKVLRDGNGNPIVLADGKYMTTNLGRPMIDQFGNLLVGPGGKPFADPSGVPANHIIGQIITNDQDQAIIADDGRVSYYTIGQIGLNPDGSMATYPNGQPRYTNYNQLLRDSKGRLSWPDSGWSAKTSVGGAGGAAAGGAGRGSGSPGAKPVVGQTDIEVDPKTGVPIYVGPGPDLVGPDGKPLLGPDGQPLGANLGQILYDPTGRPLRASTGEIMYSNVARFSTDAQGRILRGPDGRILYRNVGQLRLGSDGNPVPGPDGTPGYTNQGENVLNKHGKPYHGIDGRPVVLQTKAHQPGVPMKLRDGRPSLGPDGHPLYSNQIMLDRHGRPMMTVDGRHIPLEDGMGGQLVLGTGGQPIFDEDGNPQYTTEGHMITGMEGKPLLAADGKPLTANMGELLVGNDGTPVYSPDGQPVYSNLAQVLYKEEGAPVIGPDGKVVFYNVAQLILDAEGKPMYSKEGHAVYGVMNDFMVGADGRPKYQDHALQAGAGSQARGTQFGPDQLSYGIQGTPSQEAFASQYGVGTATTGNQVDPSLANAGVGMGVIPGYDAGAQTDGGPAGGGKIFGDGTAGPIPVGMTDAQLQGLSSKEALEADLQVRYSELQGMQRQLAADIQDKMEAIYQKLLREIANQQMTTSPYMAVGPGLGKCMGPGICTGHGMPPGTAVCQFPAADEAGRQQASCPHCHGTGRNPLGQCAHCQGSGQTMRPCFGPGGGPCAGGTAGGPCPHGLDEYKVCPGPGICPGAGVCPACKDDALHSLKAPKHETLAGAGAKTETPRKDQDELQPMEEQILSDVIKKECKTLILLPKDLDELREKVKTEGKIPNVFDEMDILERLHTLWEAVNALKHNDEALAVRMIKQDATLKKMPKGAVMEKIQKIPPENLDAIASASPERPMVIPSIASLTAVVAGESDEEDCLIPGGLAAVGAAGAGGGGGQGSKKIKAAAGGGGGIGKSTVADDDIQTIFNNLSNLLVESAAQKERLENITDVLKNMEQSMVTKHMLIDALSDKADKGQMNTKVSYDEFGNSMDELTTRMQNLLVEVYQKNENWKNITDHLGEELSAKLDKVELAPVRAYFKSHLKTLEEKVNQLTAQLEEPDPAGTRKKLLKDLNCISCDRHCNISGLTNSPQLPTIGPILAGHTTASQRAYDLHRMRQQKICKREPEGRDMNILAKELACGPGGSRRQSYEQSLNPTEVMNMVNRYTGGSHTSVTTGDRIAAMQKKMSARPGETLGEALPTEGRGGRASGFGEGQVPPPPGAAAYQAYRNSYEE